VFSPARTAVPGARAVRSPSGRAAATAEWTELARYTISAGERVLFAQRVGRTMRVTDRPSRPGGRSYLVEHEIEIEDELDALVADYLTQAAKHDRPPGAACLLVSNSEDNI
jgi:hypothetical protein